MGNMNRKIAFRAWNPDKKTWISFPKWDDAQEANGTTYSDRMELSNLEGLCIWSQFTGLLDCNGKEIYEGDVVEGQHDDFTYRYVVEYHSFLAGFCLMRIQQAHSDKGNMPKLSSRGNKELNIIGNIYETPELLNNN
jgi:uncharacterized phage protein (TIGR01671 family)